MFTAIMVKPCTLVFSIKIYFEAQGVDIRPCALYQILPVITEQEVEFL